MDSAQFSDRSPGTLAKTLDGVAAFVPDPVPATIDLDLGTVRLLARAENALGHLNGSTGRLVNPFLVGSPLLHREAILSSRIEGTITTPEELVLFEIDSPHVVEARRREEETREVQNYIRAMRHGLRRLEQLPVCLRLVRELHRELMAGVRGDRERPGEFRTVQNYIGAQGVDAIDHARFVPPPVAELERLLADLERALQPDYSPDMPTLVRLALVHYQFEAIHPFRDGNGRVGRLLIPLLLCEAQRLREPHLYLSSYFERHRQTYYDLLLDVSVNGNWRDWLRFFLRGVLNCSQEATQQVEQLAALRESYYERLQSARSSALLLKLVDRLFRHPAITIAETADLLEVTPASASSNLRKLREAKIVIEWTGRKRGQVFVAREIVAFMNDPQLPDEGD